MELIRLSYEVVCDRVVEMVVVKEQVARASRHVASECVYRHVGRVPTRGEPLATDSRPQHARLANRVSLTITPPTHRLESRLRYDTSAGVPSRH